MEHSEQEREMRGVLSTYRGRTEYMTWMPDRLVDGACWLFENPLAHWLSNGTLLVRHLKWHAMKWGVLAVICAPIFVWVLWEDFRTVPGKEAFRKANEQMRPSMSAQTGLGENEEDRARARLFASRLQPLYDPLIEGKVSIWAAAAGHRCLAYCRTWEDTVLFLGNTPGLENNDIAKIGQEAWRIAGEICHESGMEARPRRVVGLRNVSYVVVLEGGPGDEPVVVHQGQWLEPKLYPYFEKEDPASSATQDP